MISAKEAKKITEEVLQNKEIKQADEQLAKIEPFIRKAAANGENHIYVSNDLNSITKNKLRQLGYTVKEKYDDYECMSPSESTRIGW